jgi:hypothetical protein
VNLHTSNPVLDKAVARLAKALRSCQGTADRPRARKSARARSLSALRLVRAALDREFPSIVVRGTVTRLKTVRGREERLAAAGWRRTDELAGAYAAAGVPVKRIRWKDLSGRSEESLWVPDWAAAIGPDKPTQLRAAKKSRKLRNVVRTVAALAEPHE